MKKYSALFFVGATFILATCNQPIKGKNGVVYANAVAYNDYIINRQVGVAELGTKLSIETKKDLTAAEHTVDSAIAVIDKNISELEGMPAWKGDTTLQSAALALFRFYKTVFNNNYRRIIAVQKDGNLSKEEKDSAIYLMNEASKVEYLLDANLKKAQQQFGINNGLIKKKV